MSIKNIDLNEILNSAELLQSEQHNFIIEVQRTERGRKLPYEDLKTIFFFLKIAELQKEIYKLKNPNT